MRHARAWLFLALLAGCRSASAAGGQRAIEPMRWPAARFDASATVAEVSAAVQRALAPPSPAEPPPPPPPCPDDMVHIGRYCIDRHEAHLVTLGPTGELVRHPHQQRPPESSYFAARNAEGIMPQGYINRDEATRACGNAGKRLCSWLEWRRACQGKSWARYPYGHGARRGVCNVRKDHLLHLLFEGERLSYEEHFNSPRLNLEPGFLAASGQYQGCVSADGVADMAGNLHEWVSTTVTDDFVERMEAESVQRLEQPWQVGNGMFLGGFYSTVDQHGPGCTYTTIAHEPRYHDYSTGFRCCADARRQPTAPEAPARNGNSSVKR